MESRIKSCFPGYPKSEINSGWISEISTTTQEKTLGYRIFDEHCSPTTYRIQHDDNRNDTCNDFYPIHCQEKNDNKVLWLHTEGENFTLNSLSNAILTTTIQSATDCFRLGRTINQFRRLCLHSAQSLSSVEDSEPTHSSISLLNFNEDDNAPEKILDDVYAISDDDEDSLISGIN